MEKDRIELALEICAKCKYDASEVYLRKILGLVKSLRFAEAREVILKW